MPALYILIGAVLGVVCLGTACAIPLKREMKKEFDKKINEERDSFLRCQAYLEMSEHEEKSSQ